MEEKYNWRNRHPIAKTLKEYLLRRIDICPDTGCWNWTASLNTSGYGQVGGGNSRWYKTYRKQLAHQLSYVRFMVPVLGQPFDGYFVCHKCDNPRCINPAHLYAGTAQQNMQDMMDRGRSRSIGESHHAAKLSCAKVISIREALKRGEKGKRLAAQYGVSETQISRIKVGRSWEHCK